jgi:DNA-directed RNA polymerase specialized sigma24 family protein
MGGDISFLYSIAKSKSIDYMRRRKYRVDYIKGIVLEYEGFESDIETKVNNSVLYAKISREIDKFPEGQFKTILQKHYIKGIPMEEISKELKIAKRTTLNHRINGENKLRVIFGVKKK